MENNKIIIDEWKGCYPSSWRGKITEESIVHPAKFSSRLIRKIYAHMTAEGWVKPGDQILDPFGGVALGALDAMRLGLNWVGMELESRFVVLGQGNIDLWNKQFSKMPTWGSARLIQGDSRHLLETIRKAQDTVSSPPYAGSMNQPDGANDAEARAERMKKAGIDIDKFSGPNGMARQPQKYDGSVASPPFTDSLSDDGLDKKERTDLARDLGISNAEHISQIDMEKIGKRRRRGYSGDKVRGVLSSPPYADSDQNYKEGWERFHANHTPKWANDKQREAQYGESDGQLGSMPTGEFNVALASPPFRQSKGATPEPKPGGTIDKALYARHSAGNSAAKGYGQEEGQLANMDDKNFAGGGQTLEQFVHTQLRHSQGYGHSEGQLGAMADQTDFWLAARTIVEQVYLALEPGGHAVWVCKDFVKNKARVPFSDMWRQLCEAAGFETLHEHHAMLIHGKQYTLEGDLKNVTESKSFFRRLAEKKGSPRIDWETIYCMVKPKGV